MGIVFAALALLLSPVLILIAALFGVAILMRVAVPLCYGLSAGTGGGGGLDSCANCGGGLCVWGAAIFLFILIPLSLLILRIFLKRHRLP